MLQQKSISTTGTRAVVSGLLCLISACATVPSNDDVGNQAAGASGSDKKRATLSMLGDRAVDIPEVGAVGTLPPPPVHVWPDIHEDVLDNRATGNGLVSMPVMEDYLNRLYQKAKGLAGTPDWPGKVYVSSDTTINAHSSAAGNIFINIAVLQSAESEDEIFAVVSHEFGHVYLNHQAAYRAKLMTGTAVFFGRAAIALATKSIGGASWNMGDTLSVAGGVADNVVIPSWQRSVEEQADRFGVTLSLKAGYAYPAGFKTFLERLAAIERVANAKVAAQKQVVIDAKAAKARDLEQQRWDVRLSENMRNAVSDSTDKLVDKLNYWDAAANNHDDAEIREKNLTAAVLALPKAPRPRARVAPWKEVRNNQSVAEVLAHFALLGKIDALVQVHRLPEAIRLANVIASGATENDGTADIALFSLLHEENRQPLNAQIAVLLRTQKSPQPSWAALVLAAKWMATIDPVQARQFIEQQFAAFEKSPRTTPDVIGFYTDSMHSPILSVALETQCMVSNPRYRQACSDRALTEEGRQKVKAIQEGRVEAMGDRLSEKLGKAFGVKN